MSFRALKLSSFETFRELKFSNVVVEVGSWFLKLNVKVINLLILGLLNKLINFAFINLAEFDHFNTFPGWVDAGGRDLRLKTNSAQLKLKTGAELAISHLFSHKINLIIKIYITFKTVRHKIWSLFTLIILALAMLDY